MRHNQNVLIVVVIFCTELYNQFKLILNNLIIRLIG